MNRQAAVVLGVVAVLVTVPGCLQVRMTEHRIRLNRDGSGEHSLRMVDIRSDGATDSAVAHDYRVMISSFDSGAEEEFAARGRVIVEKKLYTRGDTLLAEGLRARDDEIFVVVPPEREIVRTNGTIQGKEGEIRRIVWGRDAERLVYVIREKVFSPGVSLAPYYRGEKR
jgi:hypothetical protein